MLRKSEELLRFAEQAKQRFGYKTTKWEALVTFGSRRSENFSEAKVKPVLSPFGAKQELRALVLRTSEARKDQKMFLRNTFGFGLPELNDDKSDKSERLDLGQLLAFA